MRIRWFQRKHRESRTLQRPLERPLRLVTGLILLAYATSHFLNHAFGIRSVDAMEAASAVLLAPWQTTAGLTALYTSFPVHGAFLVLPGAPLQRTAVSISGKTHPIEIVAFRDPKSWRGCSIRSTPLDPLAPGRAAACAISHRLTRTGGLSLRGRPPATRRSTPMPTKISMGVVVAAVLLGSLSHTAAEEYGRDVFSPVPELIVSSIENTRMQLDRRNATHLTAEEMAAFDRVRQLD